MVSWAVRRRKSNNRRRQRRQLLFALVEEPVDLTDPWSVTAGGPVDPDFADMFGDSAADVSVIDRLFDRLTLTPRLWEAHLHPVLSKSCGERKWMTSR